MHMKILTVDDDASVRQALAVSLRLQLQDVEVLEAADGEAGLEMFFDTNPDVVLLDVNMPRMSGFEVLREIRRVSDVPVIMLTARDEEMDQVRGLELGVDDYLHKPIRHVTLVARIKSALRRIERAAPVDTLPDFVSGDLAIHFDNREVTIAGERVKLTPIEYRLLYQLVRNAGHVLTHTVLLDRVWGTDHEVGPEYLKVFVSRLRGKLRRGSASPDYIQTERGIGYRFIKGEKSTRDLQVAGRAIGSDAPPSVWLAIDRIDPTPATRNTRRVYSQARLRELTDSIREHGVLEPILVTPAGDRYEVLAGNRRLQAARLAGLDRMPAVVRPELDERTRLLLNLVENAQRAELRPTERIGAVRQLAAAGLGVREIARGTGLSAATISRWIRIGGNTQLINALEEGRIDLFRAMYLAGIRDPGVLTELIELAPRYTPEDFYALVQQRTVAGSNGERAQASAVRQITAIADRLAAIHVIASGVEQPLQRIIESATALLQEVQEASCTSIPRSPVATPIRSRP
jgi:two-component system, OmpR family, KDP operon response regulator KdpE